MADLDALFHVLPVMFNACDRHQSNVHALNHFLPNYLSMDDRRLTSFMFERYDVMSGRSELARTVDSDGVQHWMESKLRPYLRHGVRPTEYLAVHNGVAATAAYLSTWIPFYSDPESEKIHAFTLKALITLMALESLALVWSPKGTMHATAESSLRAIEAHRELHRWITRLDTLDESVERHNVAFADDENQPFSDIDTKFFGHEGRFAELRLRITQQLAVLK